MDGFNSLVEQCPIQVHRRQAEQDGRGAQQHQPDVKTLLQRVQRRETGLKHQGEEKATQNLCAGLGDTEFLKQVIPVTVHPLVLSLITTVPRIDVSPLIAHGSP